MSEFVANVRRERRLIVAVLVLLVLAWVALAAARESSTVQHWWDEIAESTPDD